MFALWRQPRALTRWQPGSGVRISGSPLGCCAHRKPAGLEDDGCFSTVDTACAILFRHPTLQGIPDLVVEGDGYTMEFMGPTLLCLDIIDPGALGRLLAEPIKQQLPVGLGD